MRIALAGLNARSLSYLKALEDWDRHSGPRQAGHRVAGAQPAPVVSAVFDVHGAHVGKPLMTAVAALANGFPGPRLSQFGDLVVSDAPALCYRYLQEQEKLALRTADLEKKEAMQADLVSRAIDALVLFFPPSTSPYFAELYASAALEARVSIVNCSPVPMSTIPGWQQSFEEAGLLLLGDQPRSSGASLGARIAAHYPFMNALSRLAILTPNPVLAATLLLRAYLEEEPLADVKEAARHIFEAPSVQEPFGESVCSTDIVAMY